MSTTIASVRSEWAKISTVRSTAWTLVLALLTTVLVSVLLCAIQNHGFNSLSAQARATFDPVASSFSGALLGQLLLMAFGVLVVGSEYSTGVIRSSLAAVPRRATFYFSKLLVATAVALVAGLVTSFATFYAGQLALGSHHTTIGAPHVLRATLGGGLYMALIALFSMGITAMLRSSVIAISVLMPLFFIVTQILQSVSATKHIAAFLPDQAGQAMVHLVQPADHPYGPAGGLLIMVAWVAVAVLGGYLILNRRDA